MEMTHWAIWPRVGAGPLGKPRALSEPLRAACGGAEGWKTEGGTEGGRDRPPPGER